MQDLSREDIRKRMLTLLVALKKYKGVEIPPDLRRELVMALREAYKYELLTPSEAFKLAMCEGVLDIVKVTATAFYDEFDRDQAWKRIRGLRGDALSTALTERRIKREAPLLCAIENDHFDVFQYVFSLSTFDKSMIDFFRASLKHNRYRFVDFMVHALPDSINNRYLILDIVDLLIKAGWNKPAKEAWFKFVSWRNQHHNRPLSEETSNAILEMSTLTDDLELRDSMVEYVHLHPHEE